MKEIFKTLEEKERKTVGLLCLLLLIPLVFLLIVARGERSIYLNGLKSMDEKRESHEKALLTKAQKGEEWLSWQEARQDIEDIRTKYFYKDNDVFQRIRADLEEIFSQVGIRVSAIKYDYAELKKGGLKKVIVSFDWRGSYFSLKRFLSSVEKFPKFLIIEKIDFLNIGTQGERLELRMTLAGYYEI